MGDDFDVDNKEVRHYLAYFHHCFKMQPEYLKLYYRDGQIGDELRKKYKYLRKDVPEYERLFKLLKRRDDKRRIEVMHELGIIEDEVADEPAATDSNATTQEATLRMLLTTIPKTLPTTTRTQTRKTNRNIYEPKDNKTFSFLRHPLYGG